MDPVRHRAIIDVFGFLDAIPERPEWHERAACRGMGADIFFIDRGGDPRPARQICATCPVRQECYDFANQHPKERFGIWGQQSERQRRGYKVLLREACPRGHPYDAENTYIDPAGRRRCKSCRTGWFKNAKKVEPLGADQGALSSERSCNDNITT